MTPEVGLAERLQRAVVRHIGGPGTVHDLRRLTGGATKGTWVFDAEVADRRRRFIMQLTSAGAPEGSDTATAGAPTAGSNAGPGAANRRLAAQDDAALLKAARAAGVPAPEVCAVLDPGDGLGSGHITACVEGETLGARILREPKYAGARGRMAAQCGTILAAIHRIDPAATPFLRRRDAAAQLADYRRMVEGFGYRRPALELGLAWVHAHLPAPVPATVVHGDFRTGNLIVGEDGIRCVLDWELAEVGDPMQDLGWLCVKSWRFGGAAPVGGFGTRQQLFEAYEQASGTRVDGERVRFWEAFGNVKWAIMCLSMGLGRRDAGALPGLEHLVIGRRVEEPLWDFLDLIEAS